MHCPHCFHTETKVADSRLTDSGSAIRRRRKCEKCDFRFTTFERMQTSNLVVEKKDNTTEPYDRAKLEKGILIACGKRPISVERIREGILELEEQWGKEKHVSTEKIGGDVMKMLAEIDEVAYIRFASVYRQFRDVEEFKNELQKIFNL